MFDGEITDISSYVVAAVGACRARPARSPQRNMLSADNTAESPEIVGPRSLQFGFITINGWGWSMCEVC
jgi:hypothetical protein